MKDKTKKIIALEVAVLLLLLSIFGIRQYNKIIQNRQISENTETISMSTIESADETDSQTVSTEADELTVTFFDVGKGDCMLIETSQGSIMIDTGYEENGEDIVSWLQERGIDTLEYLILTHPDKDHIGGADIVINNINVENVIDTNCETKSDDYKQYKQAATDKGITILTLEDTKEINLGSATFILYPPLSDLFKGQNDYSIVTKLVYGETDFLFAGDAEDERIEELLTQISDLDSTVLKVPHHGTLMKNSEEFFDAVSPKYSIITSDLEDVYQGVTDILGNLGSKVYETGKGEIKMTSDGKTITVIQ